MILYCDTSALVKRYVREGRSEDVRRAWREARRVATSDVAYAETVAAAARRWRQGDLTDRDHEKLQERFIRDFRTLVQVPISPALNRRIANLVRTHPLRAFDAIHLASALLVRDEVRAPVVFACFDDDLACAARVEGLELLG